MDATQKQEFYSRLKGLTQAELLPALREVIKEKPAEDQKEIAETVAAAANGFLNPPDEETRNKLC
jgi:hypothetical protein